MARARNIKPSIMDNEDLAELEPLNRILFIYLWMLADREGRLEDRPKRIAAQALAYDRSADVSKMLDKLQSSGFIERYEANGIACIQIKAFAKHQTPHIREAASTLPSIEQGTTKAVPKHNLGNAEASPRSPDSGYLIPDTPYLIPDSKEDAAPRKRGTTPISKPNDVEQQTWDDWTALRAKKRTTVSQTVIDESRLECAKAGISLERFLKIWCMRGSQGLQAEWLKPAEISGAPTETTYQRSKRLQMERDFPNLTNQFKQGVNHVAAIELG